MILIHCFRQGRRWRRREQHPAKEAFEKDLTEMQVRMITSEWIFSSQTDKHMYVCTYATCAWMKTINSTRMAGSAKLARGIKCLHGNNSRIMIKG